LLLILDFHLAILIVLIQFVAVVMRLLNLIGNTQIIQIQMIIIVIC